MVKTFLQASFLAAMLVGASSAYAQYDPSGMGTGMGMGDQMQQQMIQQQQQQLQQQMQKQADFSDCMARAQSDRDRAMCHAQYGM